MPVISSTRSGGYAATTSRSFSKPTVCASMNPASMWPPSMIRLSSPFMSATLVPARGARWTSASFAVSVLRVSTTTSFGGFGPRLRSRIRTQATVWVAAMLCPKWAMQSATS